jgi:DNA-binding NarL/FixJ family response regulator
MLEAAETGFRATCDACTSRESIDATSREQAVLRLMRLGWHVTTTGRTLCSGCNPTVTTRRKASE